MYYGFELGAGDLAAFESMLTEYGFHQEIKPKEGLSIEGRPLAFKEYTKGVQTWRAHIFICTESIGILSTSNPTIEIFAHHDIPTDFSIQNMMAGNNSHKTETRGTLIQEVLQPLINQMRDRQIILEIPLTTRIESMSWRINEEKGHNFAAFYKWLQKIYSRIGPGMFQSQSKQGTDRVWCVECKQWVEIIAVWGTSTEYYSIQNNEYPRRFTRLDRLNEECYLEGLVDYLLYQERWKWIPF